MNKKKQASQRFALWLTGGIAVVVVAASVGLPFVLRSYAENWLLEHGSFTAQIDDVDFNLFTGEVGIEGVSAQNEMGDRLSLEYLAINIAVFALMDGQIDVQTMHLRGGYLDIRKNDEYHIGPLRFDSPSTSQGQPPAWGVGVRELELSDVLVAYSSDAIHQEASIEKATISDLFSRVRLVMDRSDSLVNVAGCRSSLRSIRADALPCHSTSSLSKRAFW